jgi:hypothetical protein
VKKPFSPVGRMSFNVTCNHVENISLFIKTLQIKVFHLVTNEVSIKLKFKDSHTVFETEQTEPIQAVHYNKEEITIYNWIESLSERLGVDKLLLPISELRSSNVTINIYDTRFVEENSSTSTSTSEAQTKLNQQQQQLMRNYTKKISRIIMPNMSNLKTMNLEAKMTSIGHANINFYKVLSENDDTILKQSSRFFKIFSPLYGGSGGNGMESNLTTPTGTIMTQGHMTQPEIKFQVFDNTVKPFSEEIYYNGNLIGKLEGTIELKNIPLIKQIMCGVHTERGFDISSIYLHIDQSNNSYRGENVPPELKSLQTQSISLIGQLVNMTSLTQLTQAARESNQTTLQIMNEIKVLLNKSSKESCLYYNYSSNKDLISGQTIMMELGINILKMLENFNNDQRSMGIEILILLCNRAEFDLGTLTLCLFQKNSKKDSIQICEKFIEFMNLSLTFVLERLGKSKSVDNQSKAFVEYFLSVAYFRIPKFRKIFLDIISKDINLKEFERKTSGNDEALTLLPDDNTLNPINTIIDWENLFYRKLDMYIQDSENDIKEKLQQTDEVIKHQEWKERMSKRGLAFFSMVTKLEQYIMKKIVVTKNIKWKDIPGFDKIILAINYELANREVSSYPAQLIELLMVFINDADIMNGFFKTIISRTK